MNSLILLFTLLFTACDCLAQEAWKCNYGTDSEKVYVVTTPALPLNRDTAEDRLLRLDHVGQALVVQDRDDTLAIIAPRTTRDLVSADWAPPALASKIVEALKSLRADFGCQLKQSATSSYLPLGRPTRAIYSVQIIADAAILVITALDGDVRVTQAEMNRQEGTNELGKWVQSLIPGIKEATVMSNNRLAVVKTNSVTWDEVLPRIVKATETTLMVKLEEAAPPK